MCWHLYITCSYPKTVGSSGIKCKCKQIRASLLSVFFLLFFFIIPTGFIKLYKINEHLGGEKGISDGILPHGYMQMKLIGYVVFTRLSEYWTNFIIDYAGFILVSLDLWVWQTLLCRSLDRFQRYATSTMKLFYIAYVMLRAKRSFAMLNSDLWGWIILGCDRTSYDLLTFRFRNFLLVFWLSVCEEGS